MASENEKYKEYDSATYDALREQNYRTLRDAEIQASAAKQQALKYTQNSMMQQGYANQGLSESSQLGVQNVYQKALSDAQSTYATNDASINQKQLDAFNKNGESRADNQLEYINNIYSSQGYDAANNYINGLDTSSYGQNGQDIINDYANQLKAYESNKPLQVQKELKESYVSNQNDDGIDIATMNSSMLVNSKGKTFNDAGTAGSGQENLVAKVKEMMNANEFKDGDVIDMNYGMGTELYVYIGGKLYKTTLTKKQCTANGNRYYDGDILNVKANSTYSSKNAMATEETKKNGVVYNGVKYKYDSENDKWIPAD